MRRTYAELGLLLVGLLWGLGFVVTKIGLNDGINPIYLLAIRFSISSIFFILIFNKKVKITKKDIKKILPLAVVYALAYLFQTIGSKYTTASKAGFYTALNILFVPYVSWLLNRKAPDMFTYISSLICILGISIISYVPGENLFTFNIGDALVIISSALFGTHIAINGYFSKMYRLEKTIIIQCIVGAIIYWICTIILNFVRIDHNIIRMISTSEMLSILYLGLFSTGICLLMQTYFQRYTMSTRAAIFLASESLFAPIFATLLLSEMLTKNIYIGATLILFAVLLLETKNVIILIFKKKGSK